MAAAIAIVAGAIAVPYALRDRPHDTARKATQKLPVIKKGPTKKPGVDRGALQAVAAALNATTGTGSFKVVYSLTENPPTTPTTTTCTVENSPGPYISNGPDQGPGATPATALICSGSGNHNVKTTGTATVNVNPYVMVAVSDVSNFGNVTVRVDDTNYWEITGPDSATNIPSSPGQPISGFANLVESTLGPREGAQAMMGLASPSGYLSITREAITRATEIGTGTVDGRPVTNYRVTVDPSLLAKVPGLSSEESATINAALAVMQREGFTGNTTDVSVDANGYVVYTRGVNNYADGGRVVSEDTFSAFGCAGAVQIPGLPTSIQTCSTPATTPTTAPAKP